jgi:hypothetical protein
LKKINGFVIDKIYTSVGDYNEFFDKIIRRQYPSLNDAELYRKTIEIEQSGKGEEIRFFVKKPFLFKSSGFRDFLIPAGSSTAWPAGCFIASSCKCSACDHTIINNLQLS